MKLKYVIALVTVIALPSAAQQANAQLADEQQPDKKEQPRLLGLGIQHDAAYLGANKETFLLLPLINWEAGKFFARSGKGLEEAGVHYQFSNGITLGSQVAVELGRDTDDSQLLQQLQLQDINYGVSLGAHLEYATNLGPAPLYTLIRLRQRSGSERGALADVRIELGVFGTNTIGVQVYTQATWANEQALMSDFGIAPAHAAHIPISPYVPDSGGTRDRLIGLAGKIDVSKAWMLVAALERRQLLGDAANSPIAERENMTIVTLGAIHRF